MYRLNTTDKMIFRLTLSLTKSRVTVIQIHFQCNLSIFECSFRGMLNASCAEYRVVGIQYQSRIVIVQSRLECVTRVRNASLLIGPELGRKCWHLRFFHYFLGYRMFYEPVLNFSLQYNQYGLSQSLLQSSTGRVGWEQYMRKRVCISPGGK